jgi:hypothetical protein
VSSGRSVSNSVGVALRTSLRISVTKPVNTPSTTSIAQTAKPTPQTPSTLMRRVTR